MTFFSSKGSPAIMVGRSGVWPFLFPVRLLGRDLDQHKHILGISGVGKSKLNTLIATGLILQGQACSVIDPHADLVLDVLARLADHAYFRRPDAFTQLWYVEFARTDRIMPFNILNQPYPLQITARNVLEALKRVFPSLSDGAAPVFENIVQYSVVALAQRRLPITTIAPFLTNRLFREEVLSHCCHEDTLAFFHERFDRWSERERTHSIESTLNKLSIVTFTDQVKFALGHPDNKLNFRALMDAGTSVLFNLGGLDEQTRQLLGSLLMIGFEQATLSRADLAEERRTPYHLLIDEFPQFASRDEESFVFFLDQARKFHVTLTLSHQTGRQLSRRFQSALQNALPILFQQGREDALQAAHTIGTYDPYRVKRTDRTHTTYLSLTEQVEELARQITLLRPQEAYIRLHHGFLAKKDTIVKFRTLTLSRPKASDADLSVLRESYAKKILTTPKKRASPGPPSHPLYRRRQRVA